jgi:hypothetical protein
MRAGELFVVDVESACLTRIAKMFGVKHAGFHLLGRL